MTPGATFSLLDLVGVHRVLNERVGRKVDMMTRGSPGSGPKSSGKPYAFSDAVQVFIDSGHKKHGIRPSAGP